MDKPKKLKLTDYEIYQTLGTGSVIYKFIFTFINLYSSLSI